MSSNGSVGQSGILGDEKLREVMEMNAAAQEGDERTLRTHIATVVYDVSLKTCDSLVTIMTGGGGEGLKGMAVRVLDRVAMNTLILSEITKGQVKGLGERPVDTYLEDTKPASSISKKEKKKDPADPQGSDILKAANWEKRSKPELVSAS